MEEKTVDLADFAAVLGRLGFAMGPLYHLRPFILPLYSWSAAVGRRGRLRLPWSILFIFRIIRDMLCDGGRYIELMEKGEDLGEAFRSDAKAEGQTVVVGGWESRGGAQTVSARWFAVTLTRTSAPWAFAKGEPFRTIAALELFGTLLCIMAFGGTWRRSSTGVVRIAGVTDNRGNAQALPRLMSSKFPLVVILAEMAAQMREMNVHLNLEWVPRDQNEAADDLTNGEYGRFSPDRRINLEVDKLQFKTMTKYMKAAEDIYAEVVEERKKAKAKNDENGQIRKKAKKLRETDPW